MSFCRDCLADAPPNATRCRSCGSPRLVRHGELDTLTIAHVDCDAFYATIEKRDDPSLVDKPVIVGGGKRGVVSTACYVARTYGVRSAMPMFEALGRCPHATVIRPNMAKYAEVGRAVRRAMLDLTPQVEPLVDRRSLSRSDRHRAPARHVRRQSAGAFRVPNRARARHHACRSASPPTSSSPRSPPISTSRAASRCSGRPKRRRSWRPSRSASSTASARSARPSSPPTATARSPTCSAPTSTTSCAATARKAHGCGALARGIDARKVDPDARDQKHFGGDHLRDRHRRLPPARTDAVGAHRKSLRAPESQRARRLDRHAQAQERRLQAAHARAKL